jgi:hypothetical protein
VSREPTNDLERALVAAMNDPAARPDFYRALLASELFFITPPAEKRPADQLVMVSFQGANGPFMPMFSSRERLEATLAGRMGDFEILAMPGHDAFQLLSRGQDLVVLNPGSIGKSFPPEEIAAIASGQLDLAERVVPAGRQITLGQAQVPPQALIDALSAAARNEPAIVALHLAQLHDPQSGEPPHPVVGIVAADLRAVVGALSEVAAKSSPLPVDFVGMQGTEGVAAYLAQVAPFYRR